MNSLTSIFKLALSFAFYVAQFVSKAVCSILKKIFKSGKIAKLLINNIICSQVWIVDGSNFNSNAPCLGLLKMKRKNDSKVIIQFRLTIYAISSYFVTRWASFNQFVLSLYHFFSLPYFFSSSQQIQKKSLNFKANK